MPSKHRTKKDQRRSAKPLPAEMHAFVLVLLPDRDGQPPDMGNFYRRIDPLTICGEAPVCECPFDRSNRRWKAESILPGGMFHGRVKRGDTQPIGRHDEESEFEGNLVRPLELSGSKSCFAVITPGGLWQESPEPEPQDFILSDNKSNRKRRELEVGALNRLQIAWRFEVASLLVRYQHLWVLGCDATMAVTPPRRCFIESNGPVSGYEDCA